MTMTLAEAIAEVKSGPPYEWGGYDMHPRPHWRCIYAIVRAVASGDLIPKADAEMAVAAAYQRAADDMKAKAEDEHALSQKYRGGSNPWFAHVQRAKMYAEDAAAILALAPADALAEVQALKAERNRFEAALGRACLVGGTTYLVERAEAAEAEVARLMKHIKAADDYLDKGLHLRARNVTRAALTPEKDTP